jgi:peptidoglycan/xylan/chitin deacetylase (PgdA/CDA1 family)
MIVTYHEVTPGSSRYVYSVTVSQFEKHLAAAAELASHATEPVLTFDDGHASHRRYAVPALERFGLKGTFFVTAGWTGTRDGYMTAAQLRELSSSGHDVQCHGWSHALLPQCSPAELITELRQSKSVLEDLLGRAVDAISLPGGRWNRQVLERCAEQGYRRAFTSDPYRSVRRIYGLEVRGRAMVRNTFTGEDVLALLQAEPSRWSPSRFLFAAKRTARAIVGDTIYHSVWARFGSTADKTAINDEYAEPGL